MKGLMIIIALIAVVAVSACGMAKGRGKLPSTPYGSLGVGEGLGPRQEDQVSPLRSINGAALNGQALYAQHCLTCHQGDGYGVPNFQPALVNSAILGASAQGAVAYVMYGNNAVESEWDNPMPAFARLSDAELSALMTYAREMFIDKTIAPVTVADVAAVRE